MRSAWLLISRGSGRDGRDNITGVHDESPSCPELDRQHARVLKPGSAHCRVTDLNLEQAISRKAELRQ
ncbi:MAG TPA: hypothetical protein VE420_16740, partial [Gemmatimonadales bacterium]|nr:hypothetical protein [Gemmatimonadales bacterium]